MSYKILAYIKLVMDSNWLNSEEVDPDFNYPCDPTFDGVTNLADYVVLAENWMEVE